MEGCQDHIKELRWLWALKWKRRAKIKWCTLGDENNHFFHISATINNRRNKIKVLTDNNIEHHTTQQKLSIATSYFRNFFSSPEPYSHSLHLQTLYPNQHNLTTLSNNFT